VSITVLIDQCTYHEISYGPTHSTDAPMMKPTKNTNDTANECTNNCPNECVTGSTNDTTNGNTITNLQPPTHLVQLNPKGRCNFVSTSSLPSGSNTSLSRVDSPPENTTMTHPAAGCVTRDLPRCYHTLHPSHSFRCYQPRRNLRRSVCTSPRNLKVYACYYPYLAVTSSSTAIDQ